MTRAVFLDLETTGLYLKQGSILEIALIVVEVPRLTEVARFSTVCAPNDWTQLQKMDPVVVKMHTESGLLAELQACRATLRTASQVEPALCVWLLNQTGGEKVYLAGSNPDFDRRWLEEHMPNLARKFSHRNFDVNTFFILREWIAGKEKHGTKHRALDDCLQAIQGVRDHLNWCASVFRPRSAE